MSKESTIVAGSTGSILERRVLNEDQLEIANYSITVSHKSREVKLNTRIVFLLVLIMMKEDGCEL